jgi:prepilin-type N-terminal cleavage/methylation domain-containing protein
MLQEMETGKEKIKNYKGKRGGKVMKKKGFTLIELVVVVAIILLLAATLAPKLRKEVAKARDAKAVAALGSVRTALNIFYSDTGNPPSELAGVDTDDDEFLYDASGKTSDYLEKSLVEFLATYSENATAAIPETSDGADDAVDAVPTTTAVEVGGYRTGEEEALNYGGIAKFGYDNGELYVGITGADEEATDDPTGTHDTKGNQWDKY